jgi:DNA-binding transcriptional LysR family regulator
MAERTMANDKRRPDARPLAVDLQQLRLAVAAADIGSFRQAADVLRLRQSQLSRCIRQLEHSIGIIVFERSSGGVKPTPEGREFLRTARIILEQVDALIASAKATMRGEAGRLAVGFCTSLSTGDLRATLLDFKVRFPHIEFVTVERSRTRLTTALRNGALDIVVVTGATPLQESQTLPLWRERILVALPEDHPLTTRDVVLWTELRNQTVLLSQYDPGHELEDVLISKLPLPGDRPQIERHDVSRGIIKSLISMRLGISLVMESDIGASFAGLVYRELRDGIRPSYLSFSAHWRGDNENPALHGFLKLLAERYPSPTTGE